MTDFESRLEVAQASRILYQHGVVDAFGHVSRRHPDRSDLFLMSRSMAPGLVTPDDVILHDLEGRPVLRPEARVFLERFIHAEIYRARPDVVSVAHSHAPSVIPFTVVKVPLRPLAHTCGFLHDTERAFDVADFRGGASDLLIRDGDLGRSLAQHLGKAAVVLMRGHGFTAVGESVPETVYRSIYTAVHCQLQFVAMQLGDPQYLSGAEALACEMVNRSQIDRCWSLWIDQLPKINDRPMI